MVEKIDETGAAELLCKLRSSAASTEKLYDKTNDDGYSSDSESGRSSTGTPFAHSTALSPLRMPLPLENHAATADPSASTSRSQVLERRSRIVSIGSVIEAAADRIQISRIGSVPSLVTILDPIPPQVQSMLPSPAGALTSPARDSNILLLDHHDWRNHETSSSTREVIAPSSPPSPGSKALFRPDTAASSTRVAFSPLSDGANLTKKTISPPSSTTTSPKASRKDSRKWQSFVGQTTKHSNAPVRATLRRKFNWKQYPEVCALEDHFVKQKDACSCVD